MSAKLAVSRRIRATPYTARVEALGVSDYSVVNHTVLPKGFGRSTAEDYWHLREHVQIWDVSCQRQVQLRGPDAAKLAQLMTPRDLRQAKAGQCLYVPIIDKDAGMINDPVLLKLADDRFWLSIADSDVALWAGGIAQGMGLDVIVDEPDVAPLAIQGPKAEDLMASVFGDEVREIGFFKFRYLDFHSEPLLIARSGYSKQGGFEIYLHRPDLALCLWDTLWQAGQPFNIAPGCPNLIERVEGGLLSLGNEFTRANNPLECGLGQYCTASNEIDHIGRDALQKIIRDGPVQQIRGVLFDGDPCPPCASTWPLMADGDDAGYITTAIWSPRFEQNVALGMLQKSYWQPGQKVTVHSADKQTRHGRVMRLPFND